MSSVCADQHKFHASHHLLSSKKTNHLLREIDIPPRKFHTRRTPHHDVLSSSSSDMYVDSPRFSTSDEALLRKFLPYNNASSDDEEDASDDPYSSDHFRMFEFKVRRCTRSRSHDWTDCPFAHPGEKARRRDPRRYQYSGTVCADYRRGGCNRGDSCEFAHGVFECWLHPARYRTEACKDGRNCKRKVCFFAHTPRQLRILLLNQSRSSSSPDHQASSPLSSSSFSSCNMNKYLNSANSPSSTHCCLYCHNSATSSPTSTLLGMSQLSPPMSPYGESKTHFSARQLDQMHARPAGMHSYKDVLSDLMSSLEVMKFNNNVTEASSSVSSPMGYAAAANYRSTPWIDVSAFSGAAEDPQQQFILSPSTPSSLSAGGYNYFSRSSSAAANCSRKALVFDDHQLDHSKVNDTIGGSPDPDLGWVNDLLR